MEKYPSSNSFALSLSPLGGVGGGLLFLLCFFLFSCTEEDPDTSPQGGAWGASCLLVNQGNFYDNVAGTLFFPSGQSLLIGDTPQNAVVIDSLLYVPCYASSDLAVVSLATGNVKQRISLTAPQHICTDGQRLFVTQGDGTLAVMSPMEGRTASVDIGGSPYACLACKGCVYVNCGTSADGMLTDNRVVVVNAATLAIERTVEVGQNPYDQIAADADGNVFTVCLGDYSAAPEVWKITPEGTAAPCATGNLITAADHTLYVAYVQADWSNYPHVTTTTDYSTLDTRTNVLQPLYLSFNAPSPLGGDGGGLYPSCLAISPTDGNLYIAADAAPGNYNSPGSLHVFSPSGTHLASYPAGPHPYSIVFPTKR